MANTYTSLHYHIVFSTKNREPWINPEIEERVWSYLAGIATKNRMKPIQIGGVDDHIHALLGASATLAPAKIAQVIKGGSSTWIHTEFPELKCFAWQDGYGAFTVSKSSLLDVKAYIQNQREHHKRQTYKDEFVALLKRHEIEYDELYLWD